MGGNVPHRRLPRNLVRLGNVYQRCTVRRLPLHAGLSDQGARQGWLCCRAAPACDLHELLGRRHSGAQGTVVDARQHHVLEFLLVAGRDTGDRSGKWCNGSIWESDFQDTGSSPVFPFTDGWCNWQHSPLLPECSGFKSQPVSFFSVWRSLVARSLGMGKAASSNLATLTLGAVPV